MTRTTNARLTIEQLESREVPTVLVGLSDDRSVVELDKTPAALVGTSNYTISNGPTTTDTAFLNALQANKNNFTRVWTQFQFASGASPFESSVVRGNRIYDLTKIDSAYLDRLLTFVRDANSRNIVVQVCLFDCIQIENEAKNRWELSPYNPSNSKSRFLTNDNNRFKQFLDTTGNVWQKVSSNLIDKVVSKLKNKTNVIYEVMNEPTVSQGFQNLPTEIVAFHRAAISLIRSKLEGGTGSKLVSANTQNSGDLFDWSRGEVGTGGRLATDPLVDIVSCHIATADGASVLRSYPRPSIISTDGPLASLARKDAKGIAYNLTIDEWKTELGKVVSLALGSDANYTARYGARHVELLDNRLLGTSRGDFTKTQYKIDTRFISDSPAILGIGTAPLSTGRSFAGDFMGNGRVDSAVWYSDDGAGQIGMWYIRDSLTLQLKKFQWGLPGDVPVPGNYLGSGRLELAVWRPSNQTWYILNLATGVGIQRQWGLPGDTPFPGNYLGDGHLELAVWRPSNQTWYLWDLTNDQPQQFQWGLPGDIPVPGSYIGAGQSDLAVWRPSNGTWYVRNVALNQVLTVQWGLSGDLPVPKDVNGDGILEFIIWRPSKKKFYKRP